MSIEDRLLIEDKLFCIQEVEDRLLIKTVLLVVGTSLGKGVIYWSNR